MDDQGELYFEERGYRGNQNIRPKGHKQEWTPEQIMEFIKCSNDFIYFIKKYVKIVHVDHGIIPFELWDFQEEMLEKVDKSRYSIHLFPRQSGKSTTIAAYMLHYVLFNSNKLCAILANKADSAREILGRIQEAYENLPFWLKMGVEDWNKGSFTLENGSKIIAAATSSSAIRGKSCIVGESFVTVRNKLTGEIKQVSVGVLSKELKANSSKNSKCINNTESNDFIKIYTGVKEDELDSILGNKFIK